MDRRQFVTACLAAGVGGCQTRLPADGPQPAVVDHFQGEVSISETRHEPRADADDRYHAVVANDGHEAAVEVTLFWVPRPGINPGGLTEAELEAAGYEHAADELVTVPGGGRRSVVFEGEQPPDAVGYYVRWRNLTYGGTVENRGDPGRVRVTLVDTTDMSNQRVLDDRILSLAGGERRDVPFRTRARFETFRVDATAV